MVVCRSVSPDADYDSHIEVWSSTTYTSFTSLAWSVNFDLGYTGNGFKSDFLYVRCVRGGE